MSTAKKNKGELMGIYFTIKGGKLTEKPNEGQRKEDKNNDTGKLI